MVGEWVSQTGDDWAPRIRKTLALMQRWGYAPSVEVLARQLLGGPVDPAGIQGVMEQRPEFVLQDGFACLAGSESLIPRSRERIAANGRHAGEAWGIARDYARDLMRACPLAVSVALSGSLAAGGYASRDDIDFDLIVQPGSKYTSYLVAHLVGLKYGWRLRRRPIDELHHTPLFPKVTCINVVWTTDQMRPFVRRDENMAFELLRCIPLYGIPAFQELLQQNEWVRSYFPQTFGRTFAEEPIAPPSLLGRVLAWAQRNPGIGELVERFSRRLAWRLYRGVQASRRSNPAAVARMEFLRRAKYPYEVFQD